MKRYIISSLIALIIVGLLFFSYNFYIFKKDTSNNYKKINISQSIVSTEQDGNNNYYVFQIINNSDEDYELYFPSGKEIDVEIKGVTKSLNADDKFLTSINPHEAKPHRKVLKQGDEWEYQIEVDSDSLPKGKYQLSARFIPGNVVTQNPVDMIIEIK